jgi:hypothetical protein
VRPGDDLHAEHFAQPAAFVPLFLECPGEIFLRDQTFADQQVSELVIRVGAFRDSVPKPIPSGWDYEKYKFSPGIFDSVALIQSGEATVGLISYDLLIVPLSLVSKVRAALKRSGLPLAITGI